MVVDVVAHNPQKSNEYEDEKNMYVVTPRCAAAAASVVSAVVLRRPTKEYTHPYSMMHRRLLTAGIEVAPHYHELLVGGSGEGVSGRYIVTLPFLFERRSTLPQQQQHSSSQARRCRLS